MLGYCLPRIFDVFEMCLVHYSFKHPEAHIALFDALCFLTSICLHELLQVSVCCVLSFAARPHVLAILLYRVRVCVCVRCVCVCVL